MLELFHSGTTTCSKQVRQQLVEKGVSYISRYVELWSYKNLEPAYLAMNPNGVVPTLVHDGVPIINSLAIMEYIEDVFPNPSLRPADPVLRAKQRHWSFVADEIHPSLANVTYNAIMATRNKIIDRETVEAIAARMPVPERRERFLRSAGEGFSAHDIDEAWERLDFVLGQFADALTPGPWVCGADYSLGDIAMLAIVGRCHDLKLETIAGRPALADWLTRSLARPAVKKTYATGTDEAPNRPSGTFKLQAAE